MATIYGYLHKIAKIKGEVELGPSMIEQSIHDALRSRREFRLRRDVKGGGNKGWHHYFFDSAKPLMGEDDDDLHGGPYPYPVFLYVNSHTGNVIVGSVRYAITNVVIDHINFFLRRNLQRLAFDVQKIRERLEGDSERNFFATTIQLDVNDFSSKIDNISISGGNILGVDFLSRFSIGAFTARQIGLRTSTSPIESCRLHGGGGIQFYTDRLRDLELCLGFVSSSGALLTNY